MMRAAPLSVPASPPLHFARLSTGQLSFRSHGSGPPVLFLHGLLDSSRSWAFQFAHLAKNHRVIAWDAPGYGQSDCVSPAIDAYVEVLRELVGHVGETSIALVGHAMGGTIAARFAASFPELVSRLVLCCTDPGSGDPESAPMPENFEIRMRELQAVGSVAYGLNRARELLPSSIPLCIFDYASEIASEMDPEGLRRATRMLQLADNRHSMPKLSMPTLVLTGQNDTLVKPELQAELLMLTQMTRHIEMPDVGHAPYLEAPAYYSFLIENFLAGR